jgi:hypothetical protein
MAYLGLLTPELARKLGIPESVTVISPRPSKASVQQPNSKKPPLSTGKPESKPD